MNHWIPVDRFFRNSKSNRIAESKERNIYKILKLRGKTDKSKDLVRDLWEIWSMKIIILPIISRVLEQMSMTICNVARRIKHLIKNWGTSYYYFGGRLVFWDVCKIFEETCYILPWPSETMMQRRCPWCGGYRRRNWTRQHEFKSWTRLIAFHIALIPLGKVWIQLFSLQLWVNSRTD